MNTKVIIIVVRIIILVLTAASALGFRIGSVDSLVPGHGGQFLVKSPKEMTCTFDQIGGMQEIKTEIRNRFVVPLKNWQEFYAHDFLRPPPGILFVGPPGTGKTMIAQSLATEASCSFIHVQLADVEAKYFGESSKLVRALFDTARRAQPCIIFMDEIDGIIRKRSDNDQACTYGLKTELLQHMDSQAKRNEAVLVVACTNCEASLDNAVRRRLPTTFHLKTPTMAERREIIKCIAREDPCYDQQMLTSVSDACDGYTGSDLRHLYQVASNARVMRAFAQQGSASGIVANLEPISIDDWLRSIYALKA